MLTGVGMGLTDVSGLRYDLDAFRRVAENLPHYNYIAVGDVESAFWTIPMAPHIWQYHMFVWDCMPRTFSGGRMLWDGRANLIRRFPYCFARDDVRQYARMVQTDAGGCRGAGQQRLGRPARPACRGLECHQGAAGGSPRDSARYVGFRGYCVEVRLLPYGAGGQNLGGRRQWARLRRLASDVEVEEDDDDSDVVPEEGESEEDADERDRCAKSEVMCAAEVMRVAGEVSETARAGESGLRVGRGGSGQTSGQHMCGNTCTSRAAGGRGRNVVSEPRFFFVF